MCRMVSDVTSVVHDLISEVISNHRCHMNVCMIVKGYSMRTSGARV